MTRPYYISSGYPKWGFPKARVFHSIGLVFCGFLSLQKIPIAGRNTKPQKRTDYKTVYTSEVTACGTRDATWQVNDYTNICDEQLKLTCLHDQKHLSRSLQDIEQKDIVHQFVKSTYNHLKICMDKKLQGCNIKKLDKISQG